MRLRKRHRVNFIALLISLVIIIGVVCGVKAYTKSCTAHNNFCYQPLKHTMDLGVMHHISMNSKKTEFIFENSTFKFRVPVNELSVAFVNNYDYATKLTAEFIGDKEKVVHLICIKNNCIIVNNILRDEFQFAEAYDRVLEMSVLGAKIIK